MKEIEKNLLIDCLKKFDYKKDICEYLSINIYELNKLLKENNLIFKSANSQKGKSHIKNYSFVTKEWLENHWLNTSKSLDMLSKEFNIPSGILESRRKLYSLSKRFKYKCDEKILDSENPQTAYLAGLIATDGYIPKNRLAVEIDLTGESEYKLLNNLKNYYNIDAEVKSYGNSYRLRISTANLVDFFEQEFNLYGDNKSFNVKTPKSFKSEECAKAYVLGCFDGDGSIYNKRFQFSICNASYDFIKGLADIIEFYTKQHLSIRYNINKQSNKKYPCIGTTDKKAKIILDWIYSSKCINLERKYNKYLENFN